MGDEKRQHMWSPVGGRGRGNRGYQRATGNEYSSIPSNAQVPKRQKTLSMANPVLMEVISKLRQLENMVSTMNIDGNPNRDVDHHTSHSDETSVKKPYSDPEQDIVRPPSASANGGFDSPSSDTVIARNLQVGDGNFMVICENVENRSEKQFRQVGNKNVIININSSCNKCQILDSSNQQIVPLDSEGEIWLEIKRRSASDLDRQTPTSSPTTPTSPKLNNLSKGSAKYADFARIPSRPRHTPNHDSSFNGDVNKDPIYEQVVSDQGGRLSIKVRIPMEHEDSTQFTQQNLDKFFEDDSVKRYLSSGSTDFDLNMYKWTYEKDEVYMQVPVPPTDESSPDVYSRVQRVIGREVEENEDDNGYIEGPESLPPAPPIPLGNQRWFHRDMDKRKAHDYLRNHGDGSFIVRNATQASPTHKYTIEFIDTGKIRRLKILKTEDGFHFEYSENKAFSTLGKLIDAIIVAGLEIKEDDEWKTIAVHPV